MRRIHGKKKNALPFYLLSDENGPKKLDCMVSFLSTNNFKEASDEKEAQEVLG